MRKKAIKTKKAFYPSRQCGIRKWWESKSKLFWPKKVDESSLMSFIIIQNKLECVTVWDRVPKEDAANFESDTFL